MNARRVAAALCLSGGLALLVFSSLSFRLPLRDEIPRSRALWRGNRTARVLNSLYFRIDVPLAASALNLDRTWPLSRDVVLIVDESYSEPHAEDLRRRVGYLMAPRRVVLHRQKGVPRALALLPEGGAR